MFCDVPHGFCNYSLMIAITIEITTQITMITCIAIQNRGTCIPLL